MGGKRLKFPARQKFVDTSKDVRVENKEETPLSEYEDRKRIQMLKDMGLLK